MDFKPSGFSVDPVDPRVATALVVEHHYLHRPPPISFAFSLMKGGQLFGVVTFGVPASRHLQKSVCPTDPNEVVELNRLWVDDVLGRNAESWFVSRALKQMPPRLVCSYADTAEGHAGYVYRALGFNYGGWTDMDRRTPRFDYVVPGKHTREAFRSGKMRDDVQRVRRRPKVKYWLATGDRRDRRRLSAICGWPVLSWSEIPPPLEFVK